MVAPVRNAVGRRLARLAVRDSRRASKAASLEPTDLLVGALNAGEAWWPSCPTKVSARGPAADTTGDQSTVSKTADEGS